MIKSAAFFLVLCLLPSGVLAQPAPNIRNPVINTESPEGALLAQAGTSEDPAQKIQFLETFVGKFPNNEAIGYVYFQLHGLYLGQQDFAKSAEYGKKVVALAPNDLEVRDSIIKALAGAQQWDEMLTNAVEAKAAAAKVPADQAEFAQGMLQSIAYTLYTTAYQIPEPAPKIKCVETLRQHFPESEYTKLSGEPLATAYQQAGEYEKMLEAMRDYLTHNPTNEIFLYTLGDAHTRKNELGPAKQYADQLIQLMAQKEKPEGVDDASWAKQKTLFTALGNSLLGRILVTQEKYREGRAILLQTVNPLKEQGGDAFGTLAYFLGICYVKLDVAGDNIAAARNWMTVASNTPSAYQAEAKTILSKLPKVERR
jgi:tetratricopeptide (TPR) repeat protein